MSSSFNSASFFRQEKSLILFFFSVFREKEHGYELFYFAGFSGRAEPITLLLEDGGISYTYVEKDLIDKEGNFNFNSPDFHNKTDPYCSHAFPQLEKGKVLFSDMSSFFGHF